MKEPNCAVYKFTREPGFTDDSEYEAHVSPPGLHTATYNTLNKQWADESGLVTTATAPTWVYCLVNSVIHRHNEVRWFESGCSAVSSNLTSNLTSKEIL